nr:hypothetical protein BaRGS_001333 [Batillaria attramentaria]
MSDWGVALVVVLLLAVIAISIAVLIRMFGVYRLTACFASDEERAVLTKSEQTGNGCLIHNIKSPEKGNANSVSSALNPAKNHVLSVYAVNSESSEFVLDTSGKFVQYDTLTSDPKYLDLDTGGANLGHHDDSARSSPGSVGNSSVASDLDFGHGIRRAESCDSVASDSSVLDLQPDMPRIGQIELSLEYDKPHPTIKNTTDPVFKERFLFAVEREDLFGRVLNLQVYAVDKYARQKVIGEADLRVGDVDLNMPIKIWLNLRGLDEKPAEYGDILFSLSYLPTAERLTIVIVKARNLRWREGKDSGDPFVKVYLLQNGKKISKKKTSVKRGERNPIYNEAMIFSVPSAALPTIQLRITVAEFLPGESKTPSLGHVIVGSNTSGTEASHWNQMMTSLRKPVAMWHYLRK